jgi:hypothetical protein
MSLHESLFDRYVVMIGDSRVGGIKGTLQQPGDKTLFYICHLCRTGTSGDKQYAEYVVQREMPRLSTIFAPLQICLLESDQIQERNNRDTDKKT